jgi:hypothetical protein
VKFSSSDQTDLELADLRVKRKEIVKALKLIESRISLLEDDQYGKVDQKEQLPMCPVCLSLPKHRIFQCFKCDNIICHGCLTQINTCPCCRAGFGDIAGRNPRRNKWAEKFITLHNTYNYNETQWTN